MPIDISVKNRKNCFNQEYTCAHICALNSRFWLQFEYSCVDIICYKLILPTLKLGPQFIWYFKLLAVILLFLCRWILKISTLHGHCQFHILSDPQKHGLMIFLRRKTDRRVLIFLGTLYIYKRPTFDNGPYIQSNYSKM